MIDTIRVKFNLSEEEYSNIMKKSVEYTSIDNENQKTNYKFFRVQKFFGSYDSNVNITFNEERECFIEFSLPKYLMGHNILLTDCDFFKEKIWNFWGDLRANICEIPSPDFWEFERIDFCYAWRMLDDVACSRVLSFCKALNYPRKKKFLYPSSVHYSGRDYSLKFYMKGPEFLVHDFKILNKKDVVRAYDLMKLSQGVYRFEVTVRKEQLKNLFRVNDTMGLTFCDRINNKICESILYTYLTRMIYPSEVLASHRDALNKLLLKYPPAKAIHLYQFSKMFFSEDQTDVDALSKLDRTTIYRTKMDLKDAGISFVDETPGTVQLEIPSEYSVGMT